MPFRVTAHPPKKMQRVLWEMFAAFLPSFQGAARTAGLSILHRFIYVHYLAGLALDTLDFGVLVQLLSEKRNINRR